MDSYVSVSQWWIQVSSVITILETIYSGSALWSPKFSSGSWPFHWFWSVVISLGTQRNLTSTWPGDFQVWAERMVLPHFISRNLKHFRTHVLHVQIFNFFFGSFPKYSLPSTSEAIFDGFSTHPNCSDQYLIWYAEGASSLYRANFTFVWSSGSLFKSLGSNSNEDSLLDYRVHNVFHFQHFGT